MRQQCFRLLTIFIFMVTAENFGDEIKAIPENNASLLCSAAPNSCSSEECLIDIMDYGLSILRNMNTSVDPCDNFYEFACGKFDDSDSSPKSNKFYDKANEMMERRVRKLIMDHRRSFKVDIFKSVSDFYYSCKNINVFIEYIYEDHVNYLKELVSKLGGWPVIEGENWNDADFDWIEYDTKSQNIGFEGGHFLRLRLKIDNETNDMEFFLDQPYGEFTSDQALDKKLVAAYYDYMSNVAKFLGADENQTEELEKSLQFEYDILNLAYEDDNKTDLLSVKDVYEKWPSIDWMKFLNSQLNPYFYFTNETTIHVKYPKLISDFEKLINETPKRVQANYAVWKFIKFSIPMIKSRTLFDYHKIYSEAKDPSYSIENDKLDCFEHTKNTIGALIHAFYVREYPVNKRTKDEVNLMFTNIKNKLIEKVNVPKWLDSNMKNIIIDKITSIKIVVGYPEELLDDDELIKYFKDLVITRDNFLNNYLSSQIFYNKHELFKLFNRGSSSEGMDLFTFPYYLDNFASYSAFDNIIVTSIELLRGYFFNADRFNYLNYATLGETIGHELSHSVDNTNRFFNKSGKLYTWEKDSNKNYKKRETCLINQYKNFTAEEDDTEIDETNNAAEDIADNIGVKIAYLAYQDWVAKNGPEPKLPGLSYTPNQLFWLSYANKWCQSKSLLHESEDKVHSSNDKRVNGPLPNSIEFSKDFNCPVGSNMNPSDKCTFF